MEIGAGYSTHTEADVVEFLEDVLEVLDTQSVFGLSRLLGCFYPQRIVYLTPFKPTSLNTIKLTTTSSNIAKLPDDSKYLLIAVNRTYYDTKFKIVSKCQAPAIFPLNNLKMYDLPMDDNVKYLTENVKPGLVEKLGLSREAYTSYCKKQKVNPINENEIINFIAAEYSNKDEYDKLLSSAPENLNTIEKIKDYIEETTPVYNLKAFVVHRGCGLGGHFYTLVRNGPHWYKLNDHIVSRVKIVNNHMEQAVLFLYEKQGERQGESAS